MGRGGGEAGEEDGEGAEEEEGGEDEACAVEVAEGTDDYADYEAGGDCQ